MKKGSLLDSMEEISGRLVRGIGILIFLLMCIASLFFTRYFPQDYLEEIPYNKVAVFPVTLLGAVLLLAGILFIGNKIVKDPKRAEGNLKLLLYVDLAWIMGFGIVWTVISRCEPVSDQMMVLTSAQRFAQGNYGRLEYGKYLFMHPHQLGLTAYEEVIFRIFGQENLMAVMMFNVLAIAGIAYFGYQIMGCLFREKRAVAYYLILTGICAPLLMYSTYFYGDVLSTSLSMFAVWQFLRFIKDGKKGGFALCALGACGAVLIRTNSLIVLIAFACVLFVKGIAGRRWQYLLCILLLFGGTWAGRRGLELHYERCCGHELNEGMPMVLYIAMGMQEGDKEAGWYNGYNMYTYQDVCMYHGPTAAELGKAEIRARGKEFLFHPGYAMDFCWRKFSSQWSEPTYGCFIMTYATEQERGAFAASVFEGLLNRMLRAFMDSYQLLIYGMGLLLLVRRWKEREPLEQEILLIGIIGGVLFHMLWEAKSRYVLPYFVMMLPMAAGGLYQINKIIQGRGTKDETAEAGR